MHEWVENYQEYEAVLKCKNELQVFERSVVLRAFQTFSWNDASTPGNDSSYVHEDSGTIVRYEGGLLAIDCGHDRLTDALPDLFSVLHGLGWVSVEVYHAPETMKALLTDIGKAIPANMRDFDVTPAAVEKAVSDFPESAALIEMGRSAMNMGGIDAVNGTVLEELQSMDPLFPRPASKEKQAIILLDDEPGDSDTLFVSLAGAPVVSAREAQSARVGALDPESEEPAVFELPLAPAAQCAPAMASPGAPAPSPAHTAPVTPEPAPSPIAFQSAVEEAPAARLTIIEEAPELQIPSANGIGMSKEVVSPLESEAQTGVAGPAEVDAIDVGASTIVFDSPDQPISLETVEALFNCGRYTEVVYLGPGSVGEKWRWDLLGELSDEKPWFVEKLVDAMGLDGEAAMLMSLMLTGARAANDAAQLRDILSALVERGDVRGVLGTDSHLAGQLEKYFDINAAVAQITGALAPMLLCPVGLAFVDRHDGGRGVGRGNMFCMRALLTSPDALLLVVQVDALDGRFAHWLASLLRVVAAAYGASKVYQVVAQLVAVQRKIDNELHQVESARAELGAKVTAITGEYFERLRDIGCDVPRLSGIQQ